MEAARAWNVCVCEDARARGATAMRERESLFWLHPPRVLSAGGDWSSRGWHNGWASLRIWTYHLQPRRHPRVASLILRRRLDGVYIWFLSCRVVILKNLCLFFFFEKNKSLKWFSENCFLSETTLFFFLWNLLRFSLEIGYKGEWKFYLNNFFFILEFK